MHVAQMNQVATKDTQIRVRCSSQTKKQFKKVAVDFKNSEEAILAFVKAYNQYPWVFKEVVVAKPSMK